MLEQFQPVSRQNATTKCDVITAIIVLNIHPVRKKSIAFYAQLLTNLDIINFVIFDMNHPDNPFVLTIRNLFQIFQC